jgi:WD40 repeat protein
VLLWSIAQGRQVKALAGHQGAVRTVAYSVNGRTLASGGEDSRILVWDAETGELVKTLSGTGAVVNSIVFNPKNNNVLYAATEDGLIVQWNIASGKPSNQTPIVVGP